MPFLQKLNDQIFAKDNRVTKVMASLGDTTSHILFCNSEGQIYYDYRPMSALSAVCIMEDNGKIENSYAARAFRMGAEFLTDDLIDELAQEAVDKTSILFQAIKPKGGEMPVVMGAGGSGILLHEAIGHAFEADFNRKNTSIFSDQLNKKVCNEHINVVDDGTIPFNRGSVNIDDEGVDGQKTYIVREGVLTSYLHDRISAKHYGIPSTGNGRRESFRQILSPVACHLYGSGQRDGRGDHLYRKERYLCRQLHERAGTDRRRRFYLLREGWLLDRERQAYPTYQGYQYHR